MRATTILLSLISLFLCALLSPTLAQPAQPTPTQAAPAQPRSKADRPCAQIAAACTQAGFVRNGAKTGVGIVVDCIRPIMMGNAAQGVKPLPEIDPQVVAACKQQNPNFGTGREDYGEDCEVAGAIAQDLIRGTLMAHSGVRRRRTPQCSRYNFGFSGQSWLHG